MSVIGTKTHGYLDYIVGVLLIAAPWVLNFDRGGIETWLPVILGASTILYSLLTDYELGLARVISMRVHLTLDFISGALLAVSPWLFGFEDYVWAPHLIVGLIELGVALLTTRVTGTERRHIPSHGTTVH
ncbi:hypothetical protein F0L74_27530 [Chitinophaga agrisoli]|uniref:SPW repeat-containing integral membrane domain-containing protein n=1 Tax=Chitinophaga agrisoli TaxID=2607653 RepID=A0A5B2VMM1_9BACT|nr:SPW repeat protein [Chitinophaga agrisoli]KAA2239938.1 hypothetical protein F0L74_27530 [Chitinophaga agrisoli]